MGDRWFEDKSAWESGSLPWDQRPLHIQVCRSTDGKMKFLNVAFFFSFGGMVDLNGC